MPQHIHTVTAGILIAHCDKIGDERMTAHKNHQAIHLPSSAAATLTTGIDALFRVYLSVIRPHCSAAP